MGNKLRVCDLNAWKYENDARCLRRCRFNRFKQEYSYEIARYLKSRCENDFEEEKRINKIIKFLKRLFKSKGYDIDVISFISQNKHTIELLNMSLNDLVSKLAVLSKLSLDMVALIDNTYIITLYNLNDLYAAVNILEKKKFDIGIEDLKLFLYLKDRNIYSDDKLINENIKDMYINKYLDSIYNELDMKRNSNVEMKLTLN